MALGILRYALLAALRWPATDLDPALAPRIAYCGNWHPVIVVLFHARSLFPPGGVVQLPATITIDQAAGPVRLRCTDST